MTKMIAALALAVSLVLVPSGPVLAADSDTGKAGCGHSRVPCQKPRPPLQRPTLCELEVTRLQSEVIDMRAVAVAAQVTLADRDAEVAVLEGAVYRKDQRIAKLREKVRKLRGRD